MTPPITSHDAFVLYAPFFALLALAAVLWVSVNLKR